MEFKNTFNGIQKVSPFEKCSHCTKKTFIGFKKILLRGFKINLRVEKYSPDSENVRSSEDVCEYFILQHGNRIFITKIIYKININFI